MKSARIFPTRPLEIFLGVVRFICGLVFSLLTVAIAIESSSSTLL